MSRVYLISIFVLQSYTRDNQTSLTAAARVLGIQMDEKGERERTMELYFSLPFSLSE
jgi:hypothetical protein